MTLLLISWPVFQFFAYAWIALAVIVFITLLFETAPYGRHSSQKWGPLINNRLAWVIMEIPVLIVLAFFIFQWIHEISSVVWVMLGLFCLHYFNRVFVFPFRLHTMGKKMPLLIPGLAVFFNLVNGFSLGYYFTHFAHYNMGWFSDLRFTGGVILFFTGMFINWKADNTLIHLRKPQETHYVVPEKWLFEYVSCPNLSGELLEWMGFAILCWNLPALCFFIWTAANLIPRAISHHRWYKHNFRDYPAARKAIIPYVI